MTIKKNINNKNFLQGLYLWLAGVFGFIAVLPYYNSLMGGKIFENIERSGMSLEALTLISLFQTSIMLAFFVYFGLKCSKKVGLKQPLTAHLAGIRKIQLTAWLKKHLNQALLLGIGVGFLILGSEYTLSSWLPKALMNSSSSQSPEAWKSFIASFYGGFTEEIMMRLGLLSILFFLFKKFLKKRSVDNLPTKEFWFANFVTAILFAAAHLPTTAQITPLTSIVVFRCLFLNGFPSLVYGYVYQRCGLEISMLCHFFTDLTVHVMPIFFLYFGFSIY